MNVINLVRKFVRFPWQERVWQGLDDYHDKYAAQHLAHSLGATELFKQKPASIRDLALRIACSVPPIMMTYQMTNFFDPTIKKDNKFDKLYPAEKEFLSELFGVDYEEHTTSLILVPSVKKKEMLASCIAATYLFSTNIYPIVITMDDIYEAYQNSLVGEWTAYKNMVGAGLLVLKGTGVSSKSNEKAYVMLSDIFEAREKSFRTNVIIDIPEGDVLDTLSSRKIPTKKEIQDMYKAVFNPSLRLYSKLFGMQVHLANLNVNIERILNECRQATSV